MRQEAQTCSLTDKFDAAIRRIQELDFQTKLNLASGTRMFARLVRQSQPYKDIVSCLKADVEYEEKAVVILRRMAVSDIDMRYSHPKDDPMAILALALLDTGHDPKDVVKVVEGTDSYHCFWLHKVLTEDIPLPLSRQEMIETLARTI